MNKKIFYIMIVVVFVLIISFILYHKTFVVKNDITSDNETNEIIKIKTDRDITEIPVNEVNGITPGEAEKLCYNVFGDKDIDTGFTFSFGISGAVEKDKLQYYTIRASWLVDNNHLSYIGDYFVSADGKEIYQGIARPDEYEIMDLVWSE